MTISNINTSYAYATLKTGTNSQTNAALLKSVPQSNQANSAFGIGSTGTKTIIGSPLKMSVAALAIVPEPNAPAAVFDENARMEDYLDTYKRIYDKYAAVYGDGFEFTPSYSATGVAASAASEQKVQQMKEAFHRELHANIPSKFLSCSDPDFAAKAAEKGLTLREFAILNGSFEEKPVGGNYATDTIEKMFYEEKYGLKGLSTQEQINSIMARFGNGTCHEFSAGISILFKVGAITDGECIAAISESLHYARYEEMQNALDTYDYFSFEEFFKQYWANITLHMNNAASAKYDWEDVFRNKPDHQWNGRSELVTKLFG